MNILIGDIGNTVTKLCLVDNKSYKIKKIIYFDSYNILSKKKLSLNLKKIIKSKKLNRIALFSSVVTHYESVLKKFLKRFYKIKFVEIKEKKLLNQSK